MQCSTSFDVRNIFLRVVCDAKHIGEGDRESKKIAIPSSPLFYAIHDVNWEWCVYCAYTDDFSRETFTPWAHWTLDQRGCCGFTRFSFLSFFVPLSVSSQNIWRSSGGRGSLFYPRHRLQSCANETEQDFYYFHSTKRKSNDFVVLIIHDSLQPFYCMMNTFYH